jgi:toxin ParE1/3/4
MEYEVYVGDRAWNEMLEIAAWIARESPANALRWMEQLWRAIESLGRFPHRCPIAPDVGVHRVEIRHLLVGDYRILFTLRRRSVIVLHVRHAARRTRRRR